MTTGFDYLMISKEASELSYVVLPFSLKPTNSGVSYPVLSARTPEELGRMIVEYGFTHDPRRDEVAASMQGNNMTFHVPEGKARELVAGIEGYVKLTEGEEARLKKAADDLTRIIKQAQALDYSL